MANAKAVELNPKAAQRLAEPMEEARRNAEEMRERLRRVNELEYSLVKTRDALAVVARSLGDFADGYATEENRRRGLSDDDVSTLYGVANLLECVAQQCDSAVKGGA